MVAIITDLEIYTTAIGTTTIGTTTITGMVKDLRTVISILGKV